MEYPPSHKRKNYHIISTVIVSIILLTILFLGLVSYGESIKRDNKQEVTNRFIAFENSFKSFINDNAMLLSGFSAYIDTFDEYKDDEVYSYLNNLMEENGEYINNVAIVQDTTIKWNYPLEGNEATIGIDMLTIPGQADDIAYVKETLEKDFSGPVELIQGGKGYIIRAPILKNGSFWGIASLILKEEKIIELFDTFAKENNLEVNIFKNDADECLIYGTKYNDNNNMYKFERDLLGEDLTYCVKAIDNTLINRLPYFIIIVISGLIIVAFTTYQAYLFFKGHEEILHKNFILKSSSIRDKLTGIFNRDYLDISISEEMKFANNNNIAVSLIYFDINSFKNINDTYGHAFGDSVLKDIATAIKGELRKRDVFARWGGDEFTILMPNTNINGAEITAEKVRVTIESISYDDTLVLSASIGVAEYRLGESADSWFKRVDKALYKAKENKDNRFCTCDQEGNINCYKKYQIIA